MSVRIGAYEFDHASYDARGDVLYLRAGEPEEAADTRSSPEGHAIRFDRNGNVIGLTIVNAKWLLDRDGKLTISIPDRVEAAESEIRPVLAASR